MSTVKVRARELQGRPIIYKKPAVPFGNSLQPMTIDAVRHLPKVLEMFLVNLSDY